MKQRGGKRYAVVGAWLSIIAASVAGAVACSSSSDAPVSDDAGNAVVHHDASVVDSGSDAGALVCAPQLYPGYAPVWTPSVSDPSACTKDQVKRFWDACFDDTTSSKTACDAFYDVPENSPCIRCMYTNDQSNPLGVILERANGTTTVNVAACLALVDGDDTESGCAARYLDWQNCESDACIDGCPLDRTSNASVTATYDAYSSCEAKAGGRVGVCGTYAAASSCSNDKKYDGCFFADYKAYALGVGYAVCASASDSGVPDAGVSDAEADASEADAADAGDD